MFKFFCFNFRKFYSIPLQLFFYSYIFQNITIISSFSFEIEIFYTPTSVHRKTSLKEFQYVISFHWITCNNFSDIIIFYQYFAHRITCHQFFDIITFYKFWLSDNFL